MGSGASTQIKSLDNKSKTSSEPVSTSASAVSKETTRGVTKTDNSSSLKAKADSSTTVMPLQPTPSTSHQSLEPLPVLTSKTKAGPKSSDLEKKVEQLQKELAESESDKLDLQDRIQALEERLEELNTAPPSGSALGSVTGAGTAGSNSTELQETLWAKDQYIQQMERQLASVQADSNKLRLRLKKKIKNLTAQLSEAKQESSIAQLELKEHNKSLQDQLQHSHHDNAGDLAAAASVPDGEEQDSKMKVILDLSTEVSEQALKISELQRQIEERDEEINGLKQAAVHAARTPQPSTMDHSTHTHANHHSRLPQDSMHLSRSGKPLQVQKDRLVTFSGRGGGSSVPPVESMASYDSGLGSWQQNQRPVSKIGPRSGASSRPDMELSLQRQSTILSDSDSDWEMDTPSSKIHSAPARVRVKSAASVVEEKPRNNADIDDKFGLITDDNDLTFTTEVIPNKGSISRQKRRSALKTKLERQRNERSKGLMGPSLAFEPPSGDQLSDTSCNPTPRPSDRSRGYAATDVRAFAV